MTKRQTIQTAIRLLERTEKFLLPEGKPHRLVECWWNRFEDANGCWVGPHQAVRACLLGGLLLVTKKKAPSPSVRCAEHAIMQVGDVMAHHTRAQARAHLHCAIKRLQKELEGLR